MGRTSIVKHEIPVFDGTQPIKQKPYRYGPAQEEEMEHQVQKLLQKDLIDKGTGAWRLPVVLARKKYGTYIYIYTYHNTSPNSRAAIR